jgi:O-antigen/teichoic acid export membrane protein
MSDASESAGTAAPEASLTAKIVRETSRFAVVQAFAAVLGWLAQVGLARLLDRRDFGVFGICTFYIGLGQLLGDGGLGATLLRRRDQATTEEYRATLTALLALAAVLASAMFFAAPLLAEYNKLTSQETLVLRAMAPLYFVGALRVVPYVRLERDFAFSRIARIELSANLVRHVLALGIAALHGGVWAFVIAQLASAVVQLTLAYRASPGWVGLGWSWRVFSPLVAYGSKVQALSLFSYLKDNLSRALLGAWLGPTSVGLYDFGQSYIQVPVAAVNALARVQLPVYARLDAGDATLANALRGAMRTALLCGLPVLGLLSFGAGWAVPFVYGSKWSGAFPVIWGLLLNMACGLILSPLFTLLQGQGRPGLALIVFGFWTASTWALAIVGLVAFPGSLGVVALAQSTTTLFVAAYLLGWASRHIRRNALSGLGGPLLSTLGALLAAGGLTRSGSGFFAHPLVAAATFLVVYVGMLLGLERGRIVLEVRNLVDTATGRS